MLDLLSNPLSLVVWVISLLGAITVHEFAHALIADHLGDPTPRLQGRLTLNPLAHLDPLGTIMLVLVRFGWGKPVQFDPFNLRNPRRDAALISLAGPASNLLLATVVALLLRIITNTPLLGLLHIPTIGSWALVFVVSLLNSLVVINVILAIFNLIPIHPLDGFKIVEGFLSPNQAREWHSLERYGFIFLLFLLFPLLSNTPPIQLLIGPPINFILNILLPNSASLI